MPQTPAHGTCYQSNTPLNCVPIIADSPRHGGGGKHSLLKKSYLDQIPPNSILFLYFVLMLIISLFLCKNMRNILYELVLETDQNSDYVSFLLQLPGIAESDLHV